jgi:ATP-binding cassette subfamily B protein/subfamily B ATP-binding cassette protein MsbA
MRMIANLPDEKAQDRRQVAARLIRLLGSYRWALLAVAVFTILSAATQGAGPWLIGRAVDGVVSGTAPGNLLATGGFLLVVYIVGWISTRYQIYLMGKIGQQVLADLRQRIFDRVESLSLQYVESRLAGDLMSRLVNDIEALNNFFSQGLAQMVGSFFALIGIVIGMLLLNWQLGLAVLVMVPVLWMTTTFFSRLARRAFRKTRETIGDVSADLEEELGGVKVAQAFNRTELNVQRFAQRNAANRNANVSANAVTSAFAPTMDILSTLDLALVAAMGGALAIRGVVTVGVVVAFLQYVQGFFRPIQTVAQMWTAAQSAFAAAERIFELLDTQPEIADDPDARSLPAISGEVEFDQVTFAYNEEQPVLQEVTFRVQPGDTTAIVGPTGVGKTTLVSLISRFYDVTDGAVRIDGQDVRCVTQNSLRSQMAIVTQEPFLFSGTVMENIRYGRLNATDEEVYAAARAANADEFIRRLPEAYSTDVGERGKLLSQGQRQLISIARAVLADPRLLILDEATASIDTRTEVLIQTALNRLLQGRTSFVIAHRLSTVRSASQILVLDEGRIVEQGRHEDLLAHQGMYADLYHRQFVTLAVPEG